jgi:signal transduction histidine kinase
VPLIHNDRLFGLILLAAPDYRRPLDWEDFDLLRTAGRQAASSLAEAHGQEALSNAQRFEDFNRRFAFILHDIKNLVSQLSLVARNAERHADNPEFRADMVATLKSSVGKMNDLLLRTAGRQAASTLAEANGQQALLNAQRFEDFNRRFAFILHDIKNLVSQLSLVARNAERHADNPEFRADMVATLKSSVGKMNDLLQRIAPKGEARNVRLAPVELRPLLGAAIAAHRHRHDVQLSGDAGDWVVADGGALEQAVGHLLHNAIDASPAHAPVVVRVDRDHDQVAIAIIDQGSGMDMDFVRNRLFEPFASTKDGGFGVGAFEARSLIAAMHGRLAVESRPGHGSRFLITLPLARKIAA